VVCLFDLDGARPGPSPHLAPASAAPGGLSDSQALTAIHERLLTDHGDHGGDTLAAIAEIVVATGRLVVDVEAIQADRIEDHRGWPIARIQAGQLTAYVRQAVDGGMLAELHTRDQDAADRLRLFVDGHQVWGLPLPATPLPATPLPATAAPALRTP
jgi:hypothetical protein